MESWVYIFSRFTQEALLFEALLIFISFAAYAAFYITRRRKYGAADQEIPSNLVKVYLAQLVADAEEMRNQLFGLLGKGKVDGKLFNINIIQGGAAELATKFDAGPSLASGASVDPNWGASAATAADPEAAQRLRDLEAKMQEQAKALDAVLNEKMRLEEELAVAKKKTGNAPAAADSGNEELAERLKTLEAQLAEYAVIEDDLANLKRLQKENKQLRSQLENSQAGNSTPGIGTPNAASESEPTGPVGPTASAEKKVSGPAADTTENKVSGSLEKAEEAKLSGSMEKAEEAKLSGSMEKAQAQETVVDMGEPDPTQATRIEKSATPLEVEGPAAANAAPAAGEVGPQAAADPAESEFDALVDDVEKSLAADPATPQTESEEKKAGDKSDEELQADFEKMLRS